MAIYHVGAVMLELDNSGTPIAAWFSLYDNGHSIVRFTFRDVGSARKGAELVRELVEIVETIGL
jgi:hypothetical protein